MPWWPESLNYYWQKSQYARELRQSKSKLPTKGPSMIVDAYRADSMEPCPYCGTNANVSTYYTGRKKFAEAIYKFKCACGAKF